MKKRIIFLTIFLSFSFSGFAQMAVVAPALEGILSAMLSRDIATNSHEEILKAQERMRHIDNLQDAIYTIDSLGSITAAGGRQLQDVMDTTNDLSNLMRQSKVFTKDLDELTSLDRVEAFDDLRMVKKEANRTLRDLDRFVSNTNDRIGNTADMINAIWDLVLYFDPTRDPLDLKLDEINKAMNKTNLAIENLASIIQGQHIRNKVNQEVEEKQAQLEKKLEEERSLTEQEMDKKYYDKVKNAIPSEEEIMDMMGVSNGKARIEMEKQPWRDLNGRVLRY